MFTLQNNLKKQINSTKTIIKEEQKNNNFKTDNMKIKGPAGEEENWKIES